MLPYLFLCLGMMIEIAEQHDNGQPESLSKRIADLRKEGWNVRNHPFSPHPIQVHKIVMGKTVVNFNKDVQVRFRFVVPLKPINIPKKGYKGRIYFDLPNEKRVVFVNKKGGESTLFHASDRPAIMSTKGSHDHSIPLNLPAQQDNTRLVILAQRMTEVIIDQKVIYRFYSSDYAKVLFERE